MKTEYRDPSQLTIHSAIKNQPRLALDHPTMLAMRKGMKRSGPDAREILITAENEIVDGRHWFWNAKSLQWDKVRVRIIAAEEVHAVIMETLTNRRHYSKGQLAYIVAPMLNDVFEEAKKRKWAGQSQPSALSAEGIETPESIAASMGISYRVLQQAQEIHEYFNTDKTKRTLTDRDDVTEKDVTLKAFFEARILMEEDPESPRTRAYGLGAVLAGIKQIIDLDKRRESGKGHGGGRPEKIDKQLQLFGDSMTGLQNKFVYWQKWDEDARAEAVKKLPPVVEKMPKELLLEFAKVITTELKRREK